MDYKYAVFDLDGTLLESMKVWRKHEFELIEDFIGKKLSEETKNFYKALSFTDMIGYAEKETGLKFDIEKNLTILNEKMTRDYSNGTVTLKPNVKEFLSFLQNKGVRLGIATATARKVCQPCLELYDIYKMFDCFFTTEDVGKSKQYPDVYYKAMEALGGNKENTMFFEDADYSIKTLKANGLRFTAMEDASQQYYRDEIKAISERYITNYAEIIE